MSFFGLRTARPPLDAAERLDITTFWGLDSERTLRGALPRTFQHSLALETFAVAEVDEIYASLTGPIVRLLQDFGLRCELVQFLVFIMAPESTTWAEDMPCQVKIVCVAKSMYEAESRRHQPLPHTLQSPWTVSTVLTP